MEKQKASNWKVAFDYFIPSFAIGLVISVLWGLWQSIGGASMDSNVWGMLIAAALGGFFGARRINKKYSIISSKKIAEFSLYYYMAALLALGLIIEMFSVNVAALGLISLYSAVDSVGYFLVAITIYEAEALLWIKSDSELQTK